MSTRSGRKFRPEQNDVPVEPVPAPASEPVMDVNSILDRIQTLPDDLRANFLAEVLNQSSASRADKCSLMIDALRHVPNSMAFVQELHERDQGYVTTLAEVACGRYRQGTQDAFLNQLLDYLHLNLRLIPDAVVAQLALHRQQLLAAASQTSNQTSLNGWTHQEVLADSQSESVPLPDPAAQLQAREAQMQQAQMQLQMEQQAQMQLQAQAQAQLQAQMMATSPLAVLEDSWNHLQRAEQQRTELCNSTLPQIITQLKRNTIAVQKDNIRLAMIGNEIQRGNGSVAPIGGLDEIYAHLRQAGSTAVHTTQAILCDPAVERELAEVEAQLRALGLTV